MKDVDKLSKKLNICFLRLHDIFNGLNNNITAFVFGDTIEKVGSCEMFNHSRANNIFKRLCDNLHVIIIRIRTKFISSI